MGFSHGNNLYTVLFISAILLASSCPQIAATRPLEGEHWVKKNGVAFESLPRGPVTKPGSNPCTYTPGSSTGKCTLNEMNVAGRVGHAPAAFPGYIVDLAVASVADKAHKQDESS